MLFGIDFGRLLDWFLEDFGPKLGVKLEPSWRQNQKKWGTKTMSKNHQKSYAVFRPKKATVNIDKIAVPLIFGGGRLPIRI